MNFGFYLAKWGFELDYFDLSWRFGFWLKNEVWVSKRSFKKWIFRALSSKQVSMTNKPLSFWAFYKRRKIHALKTQTRTLNSWILHFAPQSSVWQNLRYFLLFKVSMTKNKSARQVGIAKPNSLQIRTTRQIRLNSLNFA